MNEPINIKSQTFNVDLTLNVEVWNAVSSGLWEPHSFKIIDYFVKKDNTVLDLGSWIGILSLYMAKKGAKVYAIDPDPVCFKEMETNNSLNPELSKNIITRQLAIAATSEKIVLSAREHYGKSSSSILSRSRDKLNSLRVTSTTLWDFIKAENIQEVDFVKMDIEGAEFMMLPSISKAIAEMNYPTLYISFHYNYLNEHLLHSKIKSKLANKIIIKLEKMIGKNVLRWQINQVIRKCLKSLLVYDYIYTVDGQQLQASKLISHPELVKKQDLVFTNKKWIP